MTTLLILQENPSDKDLNQGTLVIFNLDPSVSNEEVRQIFGAYGEVKEVGMLLPSFP
jgi:RNA recognition motif-containing protein